LNNEYFPDIASGIDRLCFSYEVRATKPDPRAFLATLKNLTVAPESCVFTDDAETNVRGARDVGIDPIQFVRLRSPTNCTSDNPYEQWVSGGTTSSMDARGPSMPESNRATPADLFRKEV
jgi:FMN phosphatase YigB (HAD superfamily)